jgi:uncharacterized membrane protein
MECDVQHLPENIALVKGQVEFHQRQAAKFGIDPIRAAKHLRTAEQFGALLDDLLTFQAWEATHPHWATARAEAPPKRLALNWEEVEGLPPEVLAELSISDTDRTEFNIIAAIRAMGGVASLDRIIVYLFKETGELQKRSPLNQRLYRMVQKDLIFSVPGKKGVYSSEPMSEEEALNLA